MQTQETLNAKASLVLHQVKEVGTVTQKRLTLNTQNFDVHTFSLDNFRARNGCNSALQKIKILQRCTFSNTVKIMIFISDVQYYVPIKLCKTAGSIHLFKIIGKLKPENIKLNRHNIWDMLEIDWEEVSVTLNDNKINLPRVVTIKLQDKIKIRCLMKSEPILFHIMLKQGITGFTLVTGTQETI